MQKNMIGFIWMNLSLRRPAKLTLFKEGKIIMMTKYEKIIVL